MHFLLLGACFHSHSFYCKGKYIYFLSERNWGRDLTRAFIFESLIATPWSTKGIIVLGVPERKKNRKVVVRGELLSVSRAQLHLIAVMIMGSGHFISASQMRWLSLKAVKVETRAHESMVHTQDPWAPQTRVLTFFLICLFTCSRLQSSITTELQQSPLTLQPSTPATFTSSVLFLWWDMLSTTSLKIRVTCHVMRCISLLTRTLYLLAIPENRVYI